MAIIMGNAAIPGNATVPVFLLPTGLSNFTVFQPSGAQIYVGSSSRVSSTNGLAIPVSPANIESYNSTGGGLQFYATTGNSTAASFQFIISTAQ